MYTKDSENNKKISKKSSSSSSSLHRGTHVTAIYLNLYDLGGCINNCVNSIGLSFYHCGVQTHSAEYGYMGHPYKFTGLYKTSKHDSRFHLYKLRNSIEIGWTWFSENDIDQIVNELKPFYMGIDYDIINKNSIIFAKYLLEQLSNDPQLKHLEPIRILQFPSYIDRGRRLTKTLKFLQIFDREKDIAEINILYFIYMKYQGNIKELCQILQCDTIDKLKRYIKLIEQGIQENKLPIFSNYISFDIKKSYNYFYIINENKSNNEQLTLTEIFHQFDTITLRGRTSIDKYLNIQNNKHYTLSTKQYEINRILPHTHQSSLAQAISQNREETPLTSPSGSNISQLKSTNPIFTYEQIHRHTTISIETLLHLQDKLNSVSNDNHNIFSLIPNRQSKNSYLSRKRKLPRDLELTNNLYKIKNENFLRYNYTNNAKTKFQYIKSIENINIINNIDSNV